ncbi:transposase [Spirillospora sp. NPDC048911]|uniref:transposase n=1 Tax=Spirillospora sp. NPDC048911 TaxID=3364527 RepID=UPI00371688A7
MFSTVTPSGLPVSAMAGRGPDRGHDLAVLTGFRSAWYGCLTRYRDELFELTDALLCSPGPVICPVELSLEPEHRRGHGTLYAALNRGRPAVGRLRWALAALPLPPMTGADGRGRIVLAVDVTPWPRPDAACSSRRAFCHTYGRDHDQHVMIPGWPYSVIAALETGRTSWCQVLDAMRLDPDDDVAVTAVQLRTLVERLITTRQWRTGDPDVLAVFDSGYDLARLTFLVADLPVQVLGRLRSDRVLRRTAPTRAEHVLAHPAGGRPPKHGPEFRLADPDTWGTADLASTTATERHGTATAQAWDRLHPRLTRRAAWIDHPGHAAGAGRHRDPPGGRAAARRRGPQAGMAVVLGHRTQRRGRRQAVAGVPAPVRSGAHLPAVQADAGLAPAPAALARRRRCLDLARHRRPHPTTSGPPPGGGLATALGTSRPAGAAVASASAARVSQHPAAGGQPGTGTQTMCAGPRQATGITQPAPRPPPQAGKLLKRPKTLAASNHH